MARRKEISMKSKAVQFILVLLIAGITIWGLLAIMSVPARAGEQHTPNQIVTIAGAWMGAEQESFQAVLDEFTTQTGIPISYTAYTFTDLKDHLSKCGASGTCPDIAMVPSTGLISELDNLGDLVPLEPILPDFDTYYTTTWRMLGSVGDTLYALPFKADTKSIIWYRPQAFQEITATIPVSWTGLLNLSDALVASGQTPFSIGAESTGASGWPLSDWLENILVRVAGPEVDLKLVTHDIAWTNPGVVESMQRFNDIFGQNDYQLGGITGTLETNFYDALIQVFTPTHGATMYFNGTWVQTAIAERFPGLIPVTDYNFFEFPEINPQFDQPVIGGADFAVLFNNTADPQALMQFLATPDAAQIWIARGGFLSPNMGVDLNSYPDELSRMQVEQLIGAPVFLFDLDDQLPSELQQYVWNALLQYVAHPDQLMSILQGIEAEATKLQGPVYAVFLPAAMKGGGK
jgi:alpha-glucoside transport system substrate-binding protein